MKGKHIIYIVHYLHHSCTYLNIIYIFGKKEIKYDGKIILYFMISATLLKDFSRTT